MGTTRRNPKCPRSLEQDTDFRSRCLAESFSHAWDGLSYIYTTQRNMRIHVFIASLVFSACIVCGLGRTEFLMVTLAILGVLSAEVVNTLTESIVDLFRPEYSLIAKVVKDVAAAGVLLTAAFSVVIGAIAFYPALSNLPMVLSDFWNYRRSYLLVQAVIFAVPSFWGMIRFADTRQAPGREEE